MLLSSERLLNGSRMFMRELVETVRSRGIRLVAFAYVREQREFLISRYAQALKTRRWTKSLEESLAGSFRNKSLGYARVFSRHAGLFGAENLVIRVFERPKLHDGDVRIDAFELMGIDVRDLVTDEPGANASASVEEVVVMRFLNERAKEGQFKPRNFLLDSANLWRESGWEPTRELYRLVSPDLMREMGKHFAPRNERFRREFFPNATAPLFTTKIPDDYELLREDEWIDHRSFALMANHLLAVLAQRAAKKRKPRAAAALAGAPKAAGEPAAEAAAVNAASDA